MLVLKKEKDKIFKYIFFWVYMLVLFYLWLLFLGNGIIGFLLISEDLFLFEMFCRL